MKWFSLSFKLKVRTSESFRTGFGKFSKIVKAPEDDSADDEAESSFSMSVRQARTCSSVLRLIMST